MRVVLLLDRPFARRERAMLARLEIGLADEGVRVIHAVPRAILDSEPKGLYSRVIGFDDAGFPIPRRVRVSKLLSALEALTAESGGEPVDLVHAFAPAVWRLGLDTAQALGSAAAIELWSAGAVGPAMELIHHPARPVLLAADGAIMDRVRHRAGVSAAGDGVWLTPWGVHGEVVERESLEGDRAIGIAMLVDGTNVQSLDAALAGLAAACRRDPRIMAFINTGRAESHVVWRAIRKMEIADRVSLITDAEARREAILRLDALVIAEPSGRVRSMALDAMACGMPVIAAADPAVGFMIDGTTARLIHKPDASAWAEALGEIGLSTAGGALARVRASALEWVAAHRPASSHVASVLKAYDAILAARRAATV